MSEPNISQKGRFFLILYYNVKDQIWSRCTKWTFLLKFHIHCFICEWAWPIKQIRREKWESDTSSYWANCSPCYIITNPCYGLKTINGLIYHSIFVLFQVFAHMAIKNVKMADAIVQSRAVILQMTVGITVMKMNVVVPALLRKVGVAGRTP